MGAADASALPGRPPGRRPVHVPAGAGGAGRAVRYRAVTALPAVQRSVLDRPGLLPAPATGTAAAPAKRSRPAGAAAGRGRSVHRPGRRSRPARRAARRQQGGHAVAVLAGAAGVGKTALAVHWAHRVRDRFPDGQLYVNLRGYAPTAPVRPAGGARRVPARARRAGRPGPGRPGRAAALYRTVLADRRMLVVLDNARSAEQVRPLLPGSPGCVVAGHQPGRARRPGRPGRRRAPRARRAHRGRRRTRCCGRMLGRRRVDAEPDAAGELARLCGLPAAGAADRRRQPDPAPGPERRRARRRAGRGRPAGPAAGRRRRRAGRTGGVRPVVRGPAGRTRPGCSGCSAWCPARTSAPSWPAALAGADAGPTAATAGPARRRHLLTRTGAGPVRVPRPAPAVRRGAGRATGERGRAGRGDRPAARLVPGRRRRRRPRLYPRSCGCRSRCRRGPAFGTDAEALAWLDRERAGLAAAAGLAAGAAGDGAGRLAARRRAARLLLAADVRRRVARRRRRPASPPPGPPATRPARPPPSSASPTCTGCRAGTRSRSSTTPGPRRWPGAAAGTDGEGIVLTNLGTAYLWLGGCRRPPSAGSGGSSWRPGPAAPAARPRRSATSGSSTGCRASWSGPPTTTAGRWRCTASSAPRQNEAVNLANLGEAYHLLGRLDDAYDHLPGRWRCTARSATAAPRRSRCACSPPSGWTWASRTGRSSWPPRRRRSPPRPATARSRPTRSTRSAPCGTGWAGYAGRCADHERALRLARDTDTPYAELVALVGLAACHLRLGHPDRARRARRARRAGADTGGLPRGRRAGPDRPARRPPHHRGPGRGAGRRGAARWTCTAPPVTGTARPGPRCCSAAPCRLPATRPRRPAPGGMPATLFSALGAPETGDAEALLHKSRAADGGS